MRCRIGVLVFLLSLIRYCLPFRTPQFNLVVMNNLGIIREQSQTHILRLECVGNLCLQVAMCGALLLVL
jgi:hypothetical protein